jgi:hypothetical protein
MAQIIQPIDEIAPLLFGGVTGRDELDETSF